MIGRLNHVAMAVPNLDAACHFYKTVLGADVSAPTDLPVHGVRVCVVRLPGSVVELMHPLGDDSPIQKFLDKNPKGGVHHVCYDVPDIIQARDQLTAKGIRVIGDGTPKIGYHGTPVLFFHPSDCMGVLVELEEIKKGA